MKVDEALRGVSRIALDTAPVIYFIERHPAYITRVTEVFQEIDRGHLEGYTSAVSLCEVLVHPIRQGNNTLAHTYQELLLGSANFVTAPIDSRVAAKGAELRGRYNLRTPDALQIAVALEFGCQAFLTNDTGFRRVDDLRVLVLDDLQV